MIQCGLHIFPNMGLAPTRSIFPDFGAQRIVEQHNPIAASLGLPDCVCRRCLVLHAVQWAWEPISQRHFWQVWCGVYSLEALELCTQCCNVIQIIVTIIFTKRTCAICASWNAYKQCDPEKKLAVLHLPVSGYQDGTVRLWDLKASSSIAFDVFDLQKSVFCLLLGIKGHFFHPPKKK